MALFYAAVCAWVLDSEIDGATLPSGRALYVEQFLKGVLTDLADDSTGEVISLSRTFRRVSGSKVVSRQNPDLRRQELQNCGCRRPANETGICEACEL
jgi:hypothetical protein